MLVGKLTLNRGGSGVVGADQAKIGLPSAFGHLPHGNRDARIGKWRDDPEVLALSQKGFSEVAAVGRARGVDLPANIEARALQFTRNAPPELMPSMAIDLLRGNRLELPWLGGKVVALGRELGVPTPTHDVMYAALKPYANGAPA
jgi:2-dehydropantoate 2-reductase